MEKTKIGDVLLISSAMLFIVGAIAFIAGYLPNLIAATTTLALILIVAGVGLKKAGKK